ncbi:MAG: long-chain-fatty-acid--CoA ligase [Actinomycetota bacterium]
MEHNIGRFLTKRAELNPDLDAIVDVARGETFSFRQLNDRSNQTANALTGAGVVKGDRVGLLAMNSVEFEESFMAIAKIGATIVPLNWRLVADELSFILTDSDVTALIYGAEFDPVIKELHERGAGDGGTPITTWIRIGEDSGRPEFALDYAAIHAAASTDEPDVETSSDDLLYVMYTSGTTGLPKGVMHTHSTVMWALMTIDATADMHYADRYLVALPLFHVGALSPAIGCMYAGATQVVMREFDPVKVWQLIVEQKITTGLLVPAMLQFMLLVKEQVGDVEHPQLRWFMSGASPVPKSLIEAYVALGIEIHQVYGLTESCGPACLIGPDDAIARAGSTGKAFFFTEVRVVDSDGNDTADNEPGEVLVKGDHVMVGYLNRPDATAETLVDGWLHTGDVALRDEDGFIYIHDRIKDMIISGGENVYPAEIENVVMGLEGVADCAVIGVPSTKWGESPCVVAVKAEGAEITEDEIIAHCDGKLARYKLPRVAVFVSEIPRNPTGKALKRILRDDLDISLD